VSIVEAEPAGEELDPVAEQILDAALEQFQLAGMRRSSVEDVARRAGVSRVTVYRRFPRKDALIAAMAARETRRVVAAIDARTSAVEGVSDRIAESFVLLLRVAREHPLMKQLLAVEPEEVLRLLTIDGEPVIAIGTAYVAAQIRRAQLEGEAPPYDPQPVAEIVARLAHSLILTPGGAVPVGDDQAAREFARTNIAPLILRDAYDSASTSSRITPGSR
jgi:AcrR family transcriptional regulator